MVGSTGPPRHDGKKLLRLRPDIRLRENKGQDARKKTSHRRASALKSLKLTGIRRILNVGCGTGVAEFDLVQRSPPAQLIGLGPERSIQYDALGDNPTTQSFARQRGCIHLAID